MQALHSPTLDHDSARALWKSMQAQIAAQGTDASGPLRAWSKLLALSLGLAALLGLAWSLGSSAGALLVCVPLALVLAQEDAHHVLDDHVAAMVADGRLVRVLEDWCPPFAGYHLYYPSRRQPSAAVSLLVEALRWRG